MSVKCVASPLKDSVEREGGGTGTQAGRILDLEPPDRPLTVIRVA